MATKCSMYFIIHNLYDVATIYSIITTEKNVKLSYMVGSEQCSYQEQCIFPHDLLVAKTLKTFATESYIY